MNSKINGLSHMTFICKDLKKTALMLTELFGAEEIYSSGKDFYSLSKEKFFNLAGMWIAIMEGEAVEQTYNHVAFHVDKNDFPYFEEKIHALGLTLLPGRKRGEAEGDSLYFYDYDNHLFELHTGDLDVRLGYYGKK